VAETAVSKGEALEQLGRFAEAETDYRLSIERARSAGQGQIEARSLAALAHVLWLQDRFEDGQRALDEALTRAREVGATHLLSRLLYTAGTISFGLGEYRDALKLHEEALAVAREQSDLEGEAWARHGLCETRYFLGPYEEALAEGREADRMLRELGQRPMVYHNQYMIGFTLWMMGRLGEAVPVAEEALVGAREVGDRRNEAFALAARFMAAVVVGGPEGALEAIEMTLQMARDLRTPRLEVATLGFGASILLDLGQRERAHDYATRAISLSDSIGGTFSRARLFSLVGWSELLAGDDASARESFERGRRSSEGVLTEELLAGQAELRAWDDVSKADELLESSERLARAAGGESSLFSAWAHYGEARAAALHGRWAEAMDPARLALELAQRCPDRSLEWMSQLVLAQALEGAGSGDAADHARAAVAGAEELVASAAEDVRRAFLERPLLQAALALRARLEA
jgi:tetratricopeptide (TPR) repeat protein